MFQPANTTKGIRIILSMGGEDRDVCGAINEAVAWAQCDILNRMRDLPADSANYWRRK